VRGSGSDDESLTSVGDAELTGGAFDEFENEDEPEAPVALPFGAGASSGGGGDAAGDGSAQPMSNDDVGGAGIARGFEALMRAVSGDKGHRASTMDEDARAIMLDNNVSFEDIENVNACLRARRNLGAMAIDLAERIKKQRETSAANVQRHRARKKNARVVQDQVTDMSRSLTSIAARNLGDEAGERTQPPGPRRGTRGPPPRHAITQPIDPASGRAREIRNGAAVIGQASEAARMFDDDEALFDSESSEEEGAGGNGAGDTAPRITTAGDLEDCAERLGDAAYQLLSLPSQSERSAQDMRRAFQTSVLGADVSEIVRTICDRAREDAQSNRTTGTIERPLHQVPNDLLLALSALVKGAAQQVTYAVRDIVSAQQQMSRADGFEPARALMQEAVRRSARSLDGLFLADRTIADSMQNRADISETVCETLRRAEELANAAAEEGDESTVGKVTQLSRLMSQASIQPPATRQVPAFVPRTRPPAPRVEQLWVEQLDKRAESSEEESDASYTSAASSVRSSDRRGRRRGDAGGEAAASQPRQQELRESAAPFVPQARSQGLRPNAPPYVPDGRPRRDAARRAATMINRVATGQHVAVSLGTDEEEQHQTSPNVALNVGSSLKLWRVPAHVIGAPKGGDVLAACADCNESTQAPAAVHGVIPLEVSHTADGPLRLVACNHVPEDMSSVSALRVTAQRAPLEARAREKAVPVDSEFTVVAVDDGYVTAVPS